mmetsp:Transcript_43612/g.69174  ORF Transcript_43612/g.69174 Transcript_43612/m.69174 type:complete len:615 (+) Transcript_43612:59-1903(+)
MGSARSKVESPPSSPREKAPQLEKKYPMWVMRISDFLSLTKLPSHLELKSSGILHMHEAHFFTIFVSHQWLSQKHPDPSGTKISVLKGWLQNLLDRQATVEKNFLPHVLPSHRNGYHISSKRVASGYLWLDWCSLPLSSQSPHLLHQRHLAAESMAAYVQSSDLFVALVPPLEHRQTGKIAAFASWLSRGWCQSEMWTHALSLRDVVPAIAVHSMNKAEFIGAAAFEYSSTLNGEFSVASDHAICRALVTDAVDAKLAHMRSELVNGKQIDVDLFRYLSSRHHEIVGLPAKPRSIKRFMHDFYFKSALALDQTNGVGAVACAALSEDLRMLGEVVEAEAPLDCLVNRRMTFVSDTCPLHMVADRGAEGEAVLVKLLQLRANPNAADSYDGAPPLARCKSRGGVETLCLYGAEVNRHSTNGLTPLTAMCGLGAPPRAVQKMLDLKAEVNPTEAVVTPLAYLAMFYGQNPWGTETLQLLLRAKADINQCCKPAPTPAKRCLAACTRRKVVRQPTPFELLGRLGTTPLGVASHFGDEDLVRELLTMKADPQIRNTDGLRPVELAQNHRVKEMFQSPVSDQPPVLTLHLPGYDLYAVDDLDASFVATHFTDEMIRMKF